MSEPQETNWGPDPAILLAGQSKFPPEILWQYAGEWVAWTFDGTQILGHDKDLLALDKALKAQGVNTERVVYDLLPPADVDSFL